MPLDGARTGTQDSIQVVDRFHLWQNLAKAVEKDAEWTRRHHALVHGLRAEGRGLREIARQLGLGLRTVQRLDRAATWQELADGRWKGPAPASAAPSNPGCELPRSPTRPRSCARPPSTEPETSSSTTPPSSQPKTIS